MESIWYSKRFRVPLQWILRSQSGLQVFTFQINLLPQSSLWKIHYHPKDWGSRSFKNVVNCVPDNRVSHSRRPWLYLKQTFCFPRCLVRIRSKLAGKISKCAITAVGDMLYCQIHIFNMCHSNSSSWHTTV